MIDKAIIYSEDDKMLGIVHWNNIHLEKALDGITIILTFDYPIGFIPYGIYYVEVWGAKFKGRLSKDRKQILEVDYNYGSTRIKKADKGK